MKPGVCAVLGVVLVLLGLLAVLNVLDNLDGYLRVQSWADGSKKETLIAIVLFGDCWRLFPFVLAPIRIAAVKPSSR
jgi:hypothetical protein